MQQNELTQQQKRLEVKTEVITIDEDDIPIECGAISSTNLFHLANGVELIPYFEPQKNSNIAASDAESKTDNDKRTDAIKVLCTDCPQETVFDDRASFENHHKKSHKGLPVVFACVVCEYNAKKFILLRNHFKRHVVGQYQCNRVDCTSSFSHNSELIDHKTTVHGLKFCRKCKMEFEDLDKFLEHKANHASLSKPKAAKPAEKKCDICGKMLQTTGGLFTHRKMHSEKPKFRCEICQKEFFQKVNFLNHEKTHNIQNRSFSCDQCDKSFFEKSHLMRHQNFHSESRDFQCEICKKFYKTERCLKVHQLVHSDPKNRRYKCDFCQKGFLSSSKLKQHANIHTNSRPHRCKHCPRDFTNYPNLRKHTIRLHKVDHRTGKPLDKIPDYVTNKKKKKSPSSSSDRLDDEKVIQMAQEKLSNEVQTSSILNMHYEIPDNDDEIDVPLPSSSGLIRSFQFSDDTNYDILMDIDEFSDFQLLSPEKDYESHEKAHESEGFIIDASDLQFLHENSLSSNIIHQIVSGGQ